ncbi:transcriptional repressor NrdR [Candidatus Dojkabacteria bacterium]|nr:transcriptional repressor NrdR [Candidatus Dojkabacteria bacterium]
MFCPYCHSEETRVVDKRDNSETGVTRRRRECLSCSKRFTTYERIESIPLNVEKRNGNVDEFNREKLKKSILKAVRKRGIKEEVLEDLIEDIELKLLNRKKTVIKTSDIGKMVLTRLKRIDKVAYLRYSSVYNDFNSVDDFINEINLLNENNGR